MEAAQVAISRWVDKTTTGHSHSGMLLSRKKKKKKKKKKKILPFVTAWMDLENIMLSEINHQKNTNIDTICFHSYVGSNEQTELTSKIETDS